jgi:hypothetical protein
MSAMPAAMPICMEVLTSPEAAPASVAGTRASTTLTRVEAHQRRAQPGDDLAGSDLDLSLTSTRVIDERLVLLDYRGADRPGDGRG